MTTRGFLVRLRALFARRAVEAELEEELRYHLARDAELGRGRGFGNVGVIKDEVRDTWGWAWLEQLVQDLRYGVRALRKSPTFTSVAVLSLGVGIGANTAVFNLIHGILLTPLPVSRPERLAYLVDVDRRDWGFSYRSFEALRGIPGISLTTARYLDNQPVAIGQAEDFTNLLLVGADFFRTLQLVPRNGRLIGPEDFRRSERVAVLSEPMARRWFDSPVAAVGRIVLIHGVPFTVIGVTPAAFRGIEYPGYFTVAIPLPASAALDGPDFRAGDERLFSIFGRLDDSAQRVVVSAALDAAWRRCCLARGQMHIDLADMSLGIAGNKDDIRTEFAPTLNALMAGVVVVLFIACANVGNLLLLRASAREREIAVRLSLGSSRRRIVRQLLTESLMLGMLGIAAALAIAAWATGLLVRGMPDMGDAYPAMIAFHPGSAVLGFTAVVGLAATLLTGLVPALRATRRDVNESLKAAARTATHRPGLLGRGLVAIQVALALLLVSCASLMVTTLRNLQSVNIGIAVPHLNAMGVETRGTPLERAGIIPSAEAILREARGTDGVVAAAEATVAPLFGGRLSVWDVENEDGATVEEVSMAGISPGYFATTGMRMLDGRDFSALDGVGAEQVAIVGLSLAKRLYGRADVTGRTLRLHSDHLIPLRIVGVTGDVSLRGPREGATAMFYRPLSQVGRWPYVDLLLRTRSDDAATFARVAAAARDAAPGVRVRNVTTGAAQLRGWLIREILVASLASVFGALALLLAAIGIYGVISYNVARRTGELGVRMALGARGTDIVTLVLRSSFEMTGLGMAAGLPVAWFATVGFRSMLFGVSAHDPALLLLSVVTLLLVAATAASLPARRAARIDPLVALRAE